MREIKFRAWDIDSSEMIYTQDNRNCKDFFFDFDNYGLCLMMPIEEDYPEKRNAEIMQFTGLKDKNGVEIYEGDILKHNGCVCKKVVYNTEKAYFEMKFTQGGGFKDGLDYFINRNCEVIGNIRENPEL